MVNLCQLWLTTWVKCCQPVPNRVNMGQTWSTWINCGQTWSTLVYQVKKKVNQGQPCSPGSINVKRGQTGNWSTRINQHLEIKSKNT